MPLALGIDLSLSGGTGRGAHSECKRISGATGSTYVLTEDDIGFYIRCKVTATNSEGSDVAWSNAVGPVTAAASNPYDLEPEILGWKLNEGSGAALTGDATNGGDDGITDAAWATGASGSGFALDFNGSSHDAATNAAITYGVDQITVCAWIWLDDATTLQILWESTVDYNGANNTFVAYIDSGVIVGSMRAGGALTAKSVVAPSTGAWVHLMVQYDGQANNPTGDLNFFFDGVAQAETIILLNRAANANFGANTLYVGARGGSSLFFNGRIDDLRVYDHLLDATERAAVIADPQ